MTIEVKSNPTMSLYLGRQYENNVTEITFDFKKLKDEFGDGVLSLIYQKPGSTTPYPIVLDIRGDTATWWVSSADTDVVGEGEAQLTYTVGSQIKKTVIYKTKVNRSIGPSSQTEPDDFGTWLDRIAELGAQVVTDKAEALEEIDAAKDASLESIAAKEREAVSHVSDAESSALADIEAKRQSALQVIDDRVDDAREYASDAESFANDADVSAALAKKYADDAKAYAENLHFSDAGDGDISITIGG